MPDGTTGSSYDGQPIFHYMGLLDIQRVHRGSRSVSGQDYPAANPQPVCQAGCGVTTEIGAVHNTAKVQPGDGVAVFGLGGIGLAVIQRQSKARRIIAVDPDGFEPARVFGATDFVSPKDFEKPVQQVIVQKWLGSAFGGVKGQSRLFGGSRRSNEGKIALAPFVTHTIARQHK